MAAYMDVKPLMTDTITESISQLLLQMRVASGHCRPRLHAHLPGHVSTGKEPALSLSYWVLRERGQRPPSCPSPLHPARGDQRALPQPVAFAPALLTTSLQVGGLETPESPGDF